MVLTSLRISPLGCIAVVLIFCCNYARTFYAGAVGCSKPVAPVGYIFDPNALNQGEEWSCDAKNGYWLPTRRFVVATAHPMSLVNSEESTMQYSCGKRHGVHVLNQKVTCGVPSGTLTFPNENW